MTWHAWQPCYSKVVHNQQYRHKKCRISGPTSDLFNQNLSFNSILKLFRGVFKFEKLLYLKKCLKWWQFCLCLGNLISGGKRRISCYSNNILLQPCYDSEVLVRTSLTKAETSHRQLRSPGAVWCLCWNLAWDLGLAKQKQNVPLCCEWLFSIVSNIVSLTSSTYKLILVENTFCVYEFSRDRCQSFILGGKCINHINTERKANKLSRRQISLNLEGDGHL